jgi:O-antigen ligase
MILPVLYFIGVNNIKREKTVLWLLGCVSITLIGCAFNFHSTFRWMRTNVYSHDIRISGPFTNLGPNEMGVFFAMFTFLLLGISYFTDNRKLRYLLLFVCAINMYPILYSYSRATYLSVLIGLLALGLIKDRRILLVLAALVFLYSAVLPNSVVQRIDMTFVDKEDVSDNMQDMRVMDIGGVTVDTVGRKHLWETATDYFQSSPLLGIGFDTFRHKEGYITHSMYYRILAEQGIVGIVIHMIFYLMVIGQSYRLYRNSPTNLGKGVGLGFLLATLVHLMGNVSGDQALYYNIMALFWLFLGIVSRMNVVELQRDEPLAVREAARDTEEIQATAGIREAP